MKFIRKFHNKILGARDYLWYEFSRPVLVVILFGTAMVPMLSPLLHSYGVLSDGAAIIMFYILSVSYMYFWGFSKWIGKL